MKRREQHRGNTQYISGIFILIIVIGAAAVNGCGGRNVTGFTTQKTALSNGNPTADITGRVVDEDDNAVAGAKVIVADVGLVATADGAGNFSMAAPVTATEGRQLKLTVKKPGYYDAFDTIQVDTDPISGDARPAAIRMLKKPATAAESVQAEVQRVGGAVESVAPSAYSEGGASFYGTAVNVTEDVSMITLRTPSNGNATPDVTFRIGAADGQGANAAAVLGKTGMITASMAYGNPGDKEALEIFPGDFTTKSDTGAGPGDGVLITAGFVNITLRDGEGREITNFAPGTSARITMMVPDTVINPMTGTRVKQGDTVPIFIFNETSGEWVVDHNEDGSVKIAAIRQSGDGRLFVEFATTHLTWFNLDWKTAACPDGTPKIRFVDGAGQTVKGVTVYVRGSGWNKTPKYVADGALMFIGAPADVEWQVFATKDISGAVSDVVTINACKNVLTGTSEFNLVLNQATCSGDGQCDDGNPLTRDVCRTPGQPGAFCDHVSCAAACNSDASCDDGNALTVDACANPGACDATCSNTTCVAACASAPDCNDNNTNTTDACANPSTCAAACSNVPINPPACNTDAECNDGNPLTVDVCNNPGASNASCSNAACAPGCGSDSDCTTPSQGVCLNPNTCGAYCDYNTCNISCSSAAACDDANPLTQDSCSNPGTCSSQCINTACNPACASDSNCDDNIPTTVDTCSSPNTCSAACTHASCSPACGADADCNDGNPATTEVCQGAGTCGAACLITACNVACTGDAQCNDGNLYTMDKCYNPSTCDAACVNGQCVSDGQCDDGNPNTTDKCDTIPNGGSFCSNYIPGDWTQIGYPLKAGSYPIVAVNGANNPVLLWDDYLSGWQIYGRNWDGFDWAEIGAGSASGGGISNYSGTSYTPVVAVDNTWNPIVAWSSSNGGNMEIYVKRWNGTAWVEVGSGSASGGGISNNPGSSYSPAITTDGAGNPIVAWTDYSSGNSEIYIKTWNGSAWVEIGAGSASGGGISDNPGSSYRPALTVDNTGNPVVAWTDENDSDFNEEIYVKRWNGSAWVEMGAGSADGGGVSNNSGDSKTPVITTDAGGNPVAAWSDVSDGNDEIYVKRWDGSAWAEIGAGSASGGGISNSFGKSRKPTITTDLSGNPVVAWNEDGSGYIGIYLRRWTGDSWAEMGISSASGLGVSNYGGMAFSPSLTRDQFGNPIIIWQNELSQIIVEKFQAL